MFQANNKALFFLKIYFPFKQRQKIFTESILLAFRPSLPKVRRWPSSGRGALSLTGLTSLRRPTTLRPFQRLPATTSWSGIGLKITRSTSACRGGAGYYETFFVLTDCVVNYDKTLMPYFRWSANSVTRCENKKLPQFPQKLRKCGHSSFDYKSDAFQKAQTDFQIFGLLSQ